MRKLQLPCTLRPEAHLPAGSLRAHYDQKPNSLLGRFWRWHINFCPGWKAYFTNLNDAQKDELRKKYQFTKYQK